MSEQQQRLSEGLSERSYELLVRAVVDYAIYMLDPQGRIMTWNAGAEQIKGYRAEEVIGQSLAMFFPEEDRRAGKPQQMLATALREGRAQDEGWRLRKDGSRFWALTVLDSIHDEAGNLIGLAKITRDITERHEAQLRLDEMRAQLFQAQKMEALGQLTGGMAHDFNNLLTVIIGSSDLARRTSDPQRIQALLASIHEAGLRGRELTANLLTFASRRKLQTQLLDLQATLHSATGLFAQALPEGIDLALEFDSTPPPVEVDPNQLEMALLNLVLNARDAMAGRGSIRLQVSNRQLRGEWDNLHGEFVLLSVHDSGPGIAPEVQARIFEPFFTTKAFGQGTGLGLSQVYGFARNAGGAVRVQSEPGQGTCMTICLPAAPSQVDKE